MGVPQFHIHKGSIIYDQIKSADFEDISSVKKVLTRTHNKHNSTNLVTYQGSDLHLCNQALTFLKSKYKIWLSAIYVCLVNRLKIQEDELLLLTHAMTFLATHGWEQSSTPSFGHASLKQCVNGLLYIPLEKAGVDCTLVEEEWDSMVEYGKQYFDLVQNDYKVIWWKLFKSVDAKKWCNVLGVIELLFCLPLSNGHLERIFSQLKLIKSDHCIHLSENRVDQLVWPPTDGWDPSSALDIWYKK